MQATVPPPTLPETHPDYISEVEVIDNVEAVVEGLSGAGYEVDRLGLGHDPDGLLAHLRAHRPDAIFNLFEGLADQTAPRPPIVQQPASPNGGNPSQFWSIPDRDKINEGTVTVITAPAGGATSVFGSDMARVLDDEATIRVLPVLGKGPMRNVTDILFLKSIDMGAVASDVPEFQ